MPIYTKSIILFVFLICYATISAQSTSDSNIHFLGLNNTNEDFLRSIITDYTSEKINKENIARDVQVLKNQTGIVDVRVSLDTINNRPRVQFEIDERRTALPILNFGGIRDNVWYGIGFKENNFRGRGETLLAYYQNNDGRHTFQSYYRKDRIRKLNWGYSASVNAWKSIEPLYFPEGEVRYLYDNDGIGLTGIRNFGIHRQLEFGGTFFQERYKQAEEQVLENPPGPQDFTLNKLLAKVQLSQNFIDYAYFYLKGHSISLAYQNVISFDNNTRGFNSLQLESRLFLRPKEKLNVAFRAKLAISTNDDSPFAPFVADSHVNIRGIGNRIDRGTAQAVLNLEIRYTTSHVRHWATQLVVFTDSGTWRNPGGSLEDLFSQDQFRQFVGGGFRVIYRNVFGATFRIDYGIDVFNPEQRGLVIGLGQYF